VAEQKDHPILTGVSDIWGKSDVYRTYKEGTSLPTHCTALVWGQPLLGRKHDDPPNPKLEPLPVAWFKHWQTSDGKQARVFHTTMGSAHDLQSAGLRRLIINAAYWGMGMESAITRLVAWTSSAPTSHAKAVSITRNSASSRSRSRPIDNAQPDHATTCDTRLESP
jgi:hypothetical protein